MDSTFELYVMDGDEDLFWKDRPDLDAVQIELFNCYNVARREAKSGEKCSRDLLESVLNDSCYETDLAIHILQGIDDHFLQLCADKLKRQAKN